MRKRIGLSLIAMGLAGAPARVVDGDSTPLVTRLDYPDAKGTAAFGINPQGDIVGRYTDQSGVTHGFLLSRSQWTPINYPGATITRAFRINPRGQIAGNYVDAGGKTHGFLLSDGSFTTIEPEGASGGASTDASGINPEGEIVGQFSDASGVYHAFLLRLGQYFPYDAEGASFTGFWAINARGEITGHFNIPGDPKMHGFLLSREGFTQIDHPAATTMTCPFGINAEGEMVGHYFDGRLHGFLLREGVFTTIDIPGATSTEARDIAPEHEIVGVYKDTKGIEHGFLLRMDEPDGDAH